MEVNPLYLHDKRVQIPYHSIHDHVRIIRYKMIHILTPYQIDINHSYRMVCISITNLIINYEKVLMIILAVPFFSRLAAR